MKRVLPILVAVIVLAVAGYFGFTYWRQQQQANSLSTYQTATLVRGSLTAAVGATGSVHANQTTTLVWQATGTVDKVNVKLGDKVSAGDILATLNPSSLAQNLILARADLVNSQKALDDLVNTQATQIQASQAISTSQKTVIEAERALVKFDEQKYKDDLDRAKDDEAKAEKDLKTARDDFDPYKDWDPNNTTRKQYEDKFKEAQRKYDEAVRVRQLLELDKSLADTNLKLAQAQHADAVRSYGLIKNGPNPNDITALKARIAAAQATIDLAQLDAPFSGTITDVEIMPGDQVSPGKIAFRIDDLSRLFVDVRISEVDINRLQVGMPTKLTFDAINGKEYNGVVNQVSDVGIASQGVVEFLVEVELTDADESVKPGMTAAVNISVEQRENVLLVPNRAVRVQDGQRIVYVIRNRALEQVKVTLGVSSDTNSEVVDGGVLAGDTIVLNPPLVFSTNGPPPFVQR